MLFPAGSNARFAPFAPARAGATMNLMGKWRVLIAALGLCVAANAAKTFTGVVGDDMCAGDHQRMDGAADPMKCIAECVKGMGAKYALVVGTEAYILSDQAGAAKFLGKKVTVKGDLVTTTAKGVVEKSLTVKSIAAAK
jgi:hypothetical protein